MILRYALLLGIGLIATFNAYAQGTAADASRASIVARARAQCGATFVENRGQWPANVRFFGHTDGMDIWITNAGVVYDAHVESSRATERTLESAHVSPTTVHRSGHRLRMEFLGAAEARAHGEDALPGHYNYLIGRDPSRWTRGVARYRGARVEGLYPGIDAVYYFEDGRPRYDLLVAPTADPGAVRFRIAGAGYTRTTANGELAIGTSMGEIVQRDLVAYQTVAGARHRVPCRFVAAADGTVRFDVGAYDRTKPLVIDPLLYSTYLGGSGNDEAFSIAVDPGGNAYVTGYTSAWLPAPSDSFPTTVGAYDRTYNGGDIDAFVTKMDCNSDTLIYSTIIGGTSFDEMRGIVLDGSNLPVVCGFSGSPDFPTTNGAYTKNFVGGTHDGVVFKLNGNGTALLFSTYVGGHNADAVHALALMPGGAIRITGFTNSVDFPVTSGGYDTTYNGSPGDMFVATLTASGGALTSGTFIGGNVNEAPSSIVLDGVGNAYISGLTSSTDFPTTGAAYDRTYNGGQDDAFIVKVSPGDNALLYSTYIGGAGQDEATDIDLGPDAYVAFTGFTSSRDFPTTPSAYRGVYGGGAADGFICRLDINGNALAYSTYIGTSSDEYAYGIVAAADGSIFVCGSTVADSFPTTPDAYDRVHKRNTFDCFVLALSSAGNVLDYSTFVGGSDRDVANDLKLIAPNTVYFCGTTKSPDYPMGPNRYDDTLGRVRTGNEQILSYDAFVSKLDLRNVVQVTPLAPAILCPGSMLPIRWFSPRVNSVDIALSVDSGATYGVTLASNVAAGNRNYDWTVPGSLTPGAVYRIRVSASGSPAVAGYSAFLRVPPRPTRAASETSLTPCAGETINLTADAQGIGLRYQWTHDGNAIPGATSNAYSIASASIATNGAYKVRVRDTCDRDTTFDVATVTANIPTLSEVPTSRSACVGEPTTFRVATGVASPTYQWLRNGTAIAGATSATYTIASVSEADSGDYSVRIGYAPCTARPYTTAPARLSVGRVDITTQPQSVRVALGGAATFNVTAAGAGLTYQWRKNGVPIAGAVSSSFTIASAGVADTGYYDVVIGGPCTKVSNVVKLSIEGIGAVPGTLPGGTDRGISLTASPNPASGIVSVRVSSKADIRAIAGLRLALFDARGMMVKDLTTALIANGLDAAEFDVSDLAAGVYYARLDAKRWNGPAVKIVVQ